MTKKLVKYLHKLITKRSEEYNALKEKNAKLEEKLKRKEVLKELLQRNKKISSQETQTDIVHSTEASTETLEVQARNSGTQTTQQKAVTCGTAPLGIDDKESREISTQTNNQESEEYNSLKEKNAELEEKLKRKKVLEELLQRNKKIPSQETQTDIVHSTDASTNTEINSSIGRATDKEREPNVSKEGNKERGAERFSHTEIRDKKGLDDIKNKIKDLEEKNGKRKRKQKNWNNGAIASVPTGIGAVLCRKQAKKLKKKRRGTEQEIKKLKIQLNTIRDATGERQRFEVNAIS